MINKNRRHDKKIAEHRALVAAARKSERQANADAAESAKQDAIFARAQRHAGSIDPAQIPGFLYSVRQILGSKLLSEDDRAYYTQVRELLKAQQA